MIIRAAVAEDAGAISELARQLGYTASPDEVGERLPHTTSVVAELDGRILGWMEIERRAPVMTAAYAEVIALVVDAAGRGRGIGLALLDWVETWAAGRELDQVRIRCNAVRGETHAFYERRGYRVLKTQKVFAKEPRR